MTKKELSQLYWLNKEIEKDKKTLAKLEESATDTAVKISGIPHASGISDKTAIAAEIADIRALIEARTAMSIIEYNRLNRYIAGVDDSLIRQILTLRYINGLEWRQVAETIGGGNTEDSVRMAHSRYLRNH